MNFSAARTLPTVSLVILLSGCQMMPQVFSDLRPAPRPGASVEEPQPEPKPEVQRSRILTASGEPVRSSGDSPETTPTEMGEAALEIPDETLAETPADTRIETPVETQDSGSSAVALNDVSNTQETESSESAVAPLPLFALPQPTTPSALPRSAALTNDLNWQLDLDDPLGLIDAQLTEADQLDRKIDILMSAAYLVDAQLYILFRELTDRLPEPSRSTEIEQQRAWLDQRKVVLTQAFLEFEDEKAARYNAAQAFMRESRKRINQINERLASLN